ARRPPVRRRCGSMPGCARHGPGTERWAPARGLTSKPARPSGWHAATAVVPTRRRWRPGSRRIPRIGSPTCACARPGTRPGGCRRLAPACGGRGRPRAATGARRRKPAASRCCRPWRRASRARCSAGAAWGRWPRPLSSARWLAAPAGAPGTRREQMLQALAARKPRPMQRRRGLGAVAAALVFCALAGGLGWRAWNHVDTAAYSAALGETLVQPLADGSRATLASGSAIEVAISHRQRRVELLRGETIFAVAKDPERPFVVVAGRHDVIAVGTRFSVRRDVDALRVVVTEGVVRLEGSEGSGGPSALLPAGSVALVDDEGVLVRSMSPADADHLLEWRDGLLSFRDTPLS